MVGSMCVCVAQNVVYEYRSIKLAYVVTTIYMTERMNRNHFTPADTGNFIQLHENHRTSYKHVPIKP